MSTWFKPEREEYANSPILTACHQASMTATQALDELAKHTAHLLWQYQKLLEIQPPPPVVINTLTPIVGTPMRIRQQVPCTKCGCVYGNHECGECS
jgi:hypothetical protein